MLTQDVAEGRKMRPSISSASALALGAVLMAHPWRASADPGSVEPAVESMLLATRIKGTRVEPLSLWVKCLRTGLASRSYLLIPPAPHGARKTPRYQTIIFKPPGPNPMERFLKTGRLGPSARISWRFLDGIESIAITDDASARERRIIVDENHRVVRLSVPDAYIGKYLPPQVWRKEETTYIVFSRQVTLYRDKYPPIGPLGHYGASMYNIPVPRRSAVTIVTPEGPRSFHQLADHTARRRER